MHETKKKMDSGGTRHSDAHCIQDKSRLDQVTRFQDLMIRLAKNGPENRSTWLDSRRERFSVFKSDDEFEILA